MKYHVIPPLIVLGEERARKKQWEQQYSKPARHKKSVNPPILRH